MKGTKAKRRKKKFDILTIIYENLQKNLTKNQYFWQNIVKLSIFVK